MTHLYSLFIIQGPTHKRHSNVEGKPTRLHNWSPQICAYVHTMASGDVDYQYT